MDELKNLLLDVKSMLLGIALLMLAVFCQIWCFSSDTNIPALLKWIFLIVGIAKLTNAAVHKQPDAAPEDSTQEKD